MTSYFVVCKALIYGYLIIYLVVTFQKNIKVNSDILNRSKFEINDKSYIDEVLPESLESHIKEHNDIYHFSLIITNDDDLSNSIKKNFNDAIQRFLSLLEKDEKIPNFSLINCPDENFHRFCSEIGIMNTPIIKLFFKDLSISLTNKSLESNEIFSWMVDSLQPYHEVSFIDDLKNALKDDKTKITFLLVLGNDNQNVIDSYKDFFLKLALTYLRQSTFMNFSSKKFFPMLEDNIFSYSQILHSSSKNETDYDSMIYSIHDGVVIDLLNISEVFRKSSLTEFYRNVDRFISFNRFELIDEVNHSNFIHRRASGFKFFLLVINFEDPIVKDEILKFKEIARKFRPTRNYLFGFINGIEYELVLQNYGVLSTNLPDIILFDEKPLIYYHAPDTLNIDNLDAAIDDPLEMINLNPLNEKQLSRYEVLLLNIKLHLRQLYRHMTSSFANFLISIFYFILVSWTLILIVFTIKNSFNTANMTNELSRSDNSDSSYESEHEKSEMESMNTSGQGYNGNSITRRKACQISAND